MQEKDQQEETPEVGNEKTSNDSAEMAELKKDPKKWEEQADTESDSGRTLPDKTPASEKLSRYQELCRTPSIKMEEADLSVMTDLSEIISPINEAARIVDKLQDKFPEYMPERHYNLWRNNLKDAVQVLLREFHGLRNGCQQKKYDPRCICEKCHHVFMSSLPGGICDECRADMASRTPSDDSGTPSGQY